MQNSSGTLLSRFVMEVATALLTGLIGIIACYGSLEFGIGWGDAGPEPGYFPFYVGAIIIIASAVNLGMACLRHRRDVAKPFLTQEQSRRIFAFFGPMFLFVLISSLLGIYVGMILYLFGVMIYQGGYGIPKAAAISLATAAVNFCLFEVWFQVPLLKGPLEALLGIH